jgi:hypothetical protein
LPDANGEQPIDYTPDMMWGMLATASGETHRADDLAGAVDFAELVVVGRYVRVERGPAYGPPGGSQGWYAIAVLRVESAAKGIPILASDGLLRVPFLLVLGSDRYPEKEFADLQRSVPPDPALLFLFSWAAYFDLIGGNETPWLTHLDDPAKYKTIGGDGAFTIVDGLVRSPKYAEGWPVDCDGARIDAIVARIRAADGRAPGLPKPAGSAC